ncbi:putative DNA binding domain-containing protein [Flavobacterium sp. D11R37]|uniref:ATP-binding protein n=1 Tax=Flavobacterium coralii TaxID=2838017 RepID=UPI001CA6E57D|nr:ATP-binding protein [Flavobacterium coralii]MBY8962972.1 putative DNA binding domain-containing protein [Flavobacterium coralii]
MINDWEEGNNIEFKSLRKVIGKTSDVSSLSETCVCFANAQGGYIIVGIEDKDKQPPANQKINLSDINKLISRLRTLTDGVGIVHPEIHTHENGAEYFSIQILPSTRVIATTSTGKVLMRISDNCYAVKSEELTDLAAEKNAFQWELAVVQKVVLSQADAEQKSYFLFHIKKSDKVSDFIKDKTDEEILEHYQLVAPSGYLTNLGILWIGTSAQRARLSYPITFQYIVYNEREEKIRKKEWHFHLHNPMQLLLEIEKEAVELTYSTELSNGLFRNTLRNYPKEVIRELLINTIAHKRYTTSGDIFLEVYSDHVVFTNPGGLPLGISKNNILHERQRRNPHLIQILHDLKLMEGEGSGYDLIYEKLSLDAKPFPELESSYNKMSVSVYSNVVDEEALSVIDYVNKHYPLTQKEIISLGIIATMKKILSTQLSTALQLNQEDKLKYWIGNLLEQKIIIIRGKKKAAEYLLNPDLFSKAKLKLIPSLKTIEPYQLKLLVTEYLKYNGESKMTEIQEQLKEADVEDIRKMVYGMVKNGELSTTGGNKNRKYFLKKNK